MVVIHWHSRISRPNRRERIETPLIVHLVHSTLGISRPNRRERIETLTHENGELLAWASPGLTAGSGLKPDPSPINAQPEKHLPA